MIQFILIWSNLIKFVPNWTKLKQSEQIYSSLIQFEPIRSSLIQFILLYSNLIKFDPIWSSLIQFDPIWSNLKQFEPIWSCFNQIFNLMQFEDLNFQKWDNNKSWQMIRSLSKIAYCLKSKIGSDWVSLEIDIVAVVFVKVNALILVV